MSKWYRGTLCSSTNRSNKQ